MRGFSLFVVIIASGTACGAEPLPPGAVLRLGETRFRAGGEVRHLHFSKDGSIIEGWVLTRDGQLHPAAWSTVTGAAVEPVDVRSPPEEMERSITAVRLSENRVVTAGPGTAARVWDAGPGQILAALKGHSSPITAVAVSGDGKRIATGSANGLIRLWDAESFRPIHDLSGHTGTIRSIRVAANGLRVVTTGEDGSARVWNLNSGKELRGFPTLMVEEDLPDDYRSRWFWATDREGRLARHARRVTTLHAAELTPDGLAVVMSVGGQKVIRDVLTGLETIPSHEPALPAPTVSELLSGFGLSAAQSQDGRTVAVAHEDGTLGLYEVASGQLRRTLAGHRWPSRALAFTPDGTRLLSGGLEQSVLVWAVRVQDLPLPKAVQQETRAGRLWTMLTSEPADAAYLAMARFAAEPPAAVKMARLRLKPAESPQEDAVARIAETRAIELLESLGTHEAKEFLAELAAGNATAHLTQEAKRALVRAMGGGW